jgi:NADPH:quinone reductase-like Zn-dependent oxidoreductase
MRAAVRTGWGGIDVVEIRDVAQPVATGDRVVVRVHAASVNRADLDMLGPQPGFLRLILGVRAPRDPGLGCDVAGVVETVGPEVTRFRPGDRVFADLFPFGLGSFADFAAAPERAFLPIPPAMPFDHAATLPHSAVLAVQGLRLRDGRTVRPGQRVLISGASGNVGPFAVQIAKALGADVTGVCSTDSVEFVRSLGADHVIDYTVLDYTTTGERYDWIVDVHSHHSVLEVRRSLRRGGVYVTLGGTTPDLVQSMAVGPVASLATHRRMSMMLWWKPFRAEDVATLTDMYAARDLVPTIDRTYALPEIVEALRHVDTGHPRGKVIVVP